MGRTRKADILRKGAALAALGLAAILAREAAAQTPARIVEFWENPSSIASDDNDTGGHPSAGLPACDPPALSPLEGVIDGVAASEVPTQGWIGGGVPGRLFWGGYTAGTGADANQRIIIDNWEDMSPSGFKNSFLLFENHNTANPGAALGSYIYTHFGSDVTPATAPAGTLIAPKMIDLSGAGSRFLLGLNEQQILFADAARQTTVRFLLQERGQTWYVSDPVNSTQFNLFTGIGGGASFAGLDADTLTPASRLAGFRASTVAGLDWHAVNTDDGSDAQDVMNLLDCGGPEAAIGFSGSDDSPEFTKITGMGLLLGELAQGNNTLFPGRLNGVMVLGMALEGRNPAQSFVAVRPETLTINEGLDGAGNPSLNFVIEGWNTRLDGQSLFIDFATGAGGDTADGLGCDYVTINTAGADAGLRLEFPPGYTRLTRSIPIVNDRAHELAAETFTTIFTNPDPALIELQGGTQVATILDTDPLPKIFIADTSILEGDPDGYPNGTQSVLMQFSVTIDRPSYLPLQADVSLAGETAIENCDYLTATDPAVIMFEATPCVDPVPAKPLLVNVAGDLYDETDQETFRAILGNLVNVEAGDLEAVGTIDDNDPLPEIVISPATASEADGVMNFVLSLRDPRNPSGPAVESGKTISFDFATSPETARAECDYTSISSSRVFEPTAGCASTQVNGQLIPVTMLQDLFDEFDDTFHVTLSNLANTAPGAIDAVGTITDDDPLPIIEVLDLIPNEPNAPGPADRIASGVEDTGQIRFILHLKNPDGSFAQSEKPVSFIYRTQTIPGTHSACDYPEVEEAAGFQVLGACGESTNTVTVTVPVNIDPIDEVDEDMLIAFGSAVNAQFPASAPGIVAIGVILDDDPEPFLVISDTMTEEGISPAVLEVSLVNALGEPTQSGKTVSVDFRTTTGLAVEGAALSGLDFEATTATLVFSPLGECSLTENPEEALVAVVDDVIYEYAEKFRGLLSNPVNAQILDGIGVGTIEDDDVPPQLSVEAPAAPVSEAASMRASFVPPVGNQADFIVRLNTPSGRPISVVYETIDGSAEAGADFSPKKGFLNLFVDEGTGVTGTTTTLSVPILNDFSFEPVEQFSLALTSQPSNATIAPGLGSASATIIDDDEPKIFLETWDLVDSQPRDYAAGLVPGADNPFEGLAGAATPFSAVRFAPLAGVEGVSPRLQRAEFATGGSFFGNALKSPFPYTFYANQVTSITLGARVFFGAATPANAGTTGTLTNFTLVLGDGGSGDFEESGLPSLPGSFGDASLAVEVNNDVLGAAGLKPRVRVAINNALFLSGGSEPPFSATAELLPIGGGLPWNQPGVTGYEYYVSVTFIQLGLYETIVQAAVQPLDGGPISTGGGVAQQSLDAAFPFNRRINQIAALVGANFGRSDGFPPTVVTGVLPIAPVLIDGVAALLTINGTNIGAAAVLANDADSALRNQINLHVGATGVVASVNAFNQLVLTAADGRDVTLTTTGSIADQLGLIAIDGDVTNQTTPGGPPAFEGSWVDDICVRTLGFDGLPIARTHQWKRYE